MKKRAYLVSGAGSGIGRAIALKLSQASIDNRIILLGRNLERLERVRAELPNSTQHRIIIADQTNREDLARAIREANLEDENLVSVIANAGLGGENHYGGTDRWNEIIQTNLYGTYYLVQECLPALRTAEDTYKHVLVTSSVLSRLGVPKYTAYCASKAALLGLTRSWAAELAVEKILVNAICPGWVETDMAEEGLEGIAKASGCPTEEVRKKELDKVPLGKMSTPDEIASLVQFLVSGNQTSITGQSLDINGGSIMM